MKKEALALDALQERCAICGSPRGYHAANDDACPSVPANSAWEKIGGFYHPTNKFKPVEHGK